MGTDDNGYELAVCHQLGKAAKLRTGTRFSTDSRSFSPGSLRRSRMNSDKRDLRDRSCRKACRSATAFPLVLAGQPENAFASSSPTSTLPPPQFCHPPPGISRLKAIPVRVWSSRLPRLHSLHQQTLLQHEIAFLRASPRHLPAVLLAATSPVLPVPWACDRTRAP